VGTVQCWAMMVAAWLAVSGVPSVSQITPASVHYGTAHEIRAQRAATLNAAYAANPARFRHRRPQPPKLPTVAWINEPTPEALIKSA
jgi:hypothetical protein